MKNQNFFGSKVKHKRKELNLTLEELGKMISSTKAYVWELETKKVSRPSADKVLLLSRALNVSMEYLIDDKINMGTYPDSKCFKCEQVKKILTK